MYLDNTQSLQIVLAGAKTSLDAQGQVSFETVPINQTPGGPAPAPYPQTVPFTTNGTTVVPLVPAPSAGWVNKIQALQLNNADTGSITVLIQIVTAVVSAGVTTTTTRTIFKGTRATLEQLNYTLGGGWKAYSVAMAGQ